MRVGDIEAALAFYGRLFAFELRSKSATDAFIDLGDQFIALQKGRRQPADDGRSKVTGREASRSTVCGSTSGRMRVRPASARV